MSKNISKRKKKSNKKNRSSKTNSSKNKKIKSKCNTNKDINKKKLSNCPSVQNKKKIQKGGTYSCRRKEQPLRPRLYRKAQSSNILEDYPNAPPFPPDFLDDCAIM